MPEYVTRAAPGSHDVDDLVEVRDRFADASAPFLAFPWSWLAWSVLLPAAALATRPVLAAGGWPPAVLLWSFTILAGGAVELVGIRRARRTVRASPLGGWVLSVQGNLSLVALSLSLALLAVGRGGLVPAVWLLLLGHSFFGFGGLAFPPFRLYGLIYQAAGILALWPRVDPLVVLAAATFLGNLWMAAAVARARRDRLGA